MKRLASRGVHRLKRALKPGAARMFPVPNEKAFRAARRAAERYAALGGWAISVNALRALIAALDSMHVLRVVEFGPGASTVFLDAYLDPAVSIESYEHHPQYARRVAAATSARAQVKLCPLVQFTDEDFESIISCSDNGAPEKKTRLVPESDFDKTRLRNTFYELDQLAGPIDVVVLDGPNGNGRSIGLAKVKHELSPGAVILIDDCNHYPFVEHCIDLFHPEILAGQVCDYDSWILMRVP